MATVRRPGPPVPPRPQTILLKSRDSARNLSSISASSNRSTALRTVVGCSSPSADGRTVVYKSPSFNLQKRQEQREKRYSFNTADGFHAAPPPLHTKPAVASKKPKPSAPVKVVKELTNKSPSSAIDNCTKIVIVGDNNNNNNESPVPKPRTLISKVPGGFLRRSKTTLDNFTRSTITIGDNNNNNTNSPTSSGFMLGKTFDIKNNLKNAAERLFSEIVSHSKDSKCQTKSMNTLPPLNRSESCKSKDSLQIEPDLNGNCIPSPLKPRLEDPIPPEKKIVFQEMLISELAAMRQRSCSVDQLNSRSEYRDDHDHIGDFKSEDDKGFDDGSLGGIDNKSLGDKSMDDSGTGSAVTLQLTEIPVKSKRVRQRCPSGCSTDSSPCGPDQMRIRTSDWIEVGENGKEEVMTICQISLEDSGMEDEERPDDGSSGVGDSWDSVKEAKKQEDEEEHEREIRLRERRKVSMADLPPLPKSLSTNQTFNEPSDENIDCENEVEHTDNTGEVIGSTLGKQLAVLRKEMYGLRQLDISLLSQLWTLNDSIQNFRTMVDDQECYSPSPPPHSPSPSPYDSVSSDAEEDHSPSIESQLQYHSEIPIQIQTSSRIKSPTQSPTHSSPTNISPITLTSTPLFQRPITTQPILRNTTPPTPTPRTPVKQSPPSTSLQRQIPSKHLPPPPAPPTTRPPVERLSTRPVSTSANNKLLHVPVPVPVQRMRIAPPPPPVQRRSIVQPSRNS